VVDARGVPLAHVLTPANVTDSRAFELALGALRPIRRPRGEPGRPRRWPLKLHGDKAYDRRHCREFLAQHRIVARIARIGVESSERLGRHRWVVERTEAWFNRFRRLRVRDERLASIHEALVSLAASLILFSYLQRTF
jgi:transposase